MLYLYAKAIHIIFVVCWMAGLFYMPRLFIYHVEAKAKGATAYSVLHEQFKVMEHRLWWIITTPAMVLTVLSALVMLCLQPGLLSTAWMQVKLCFVLLLLGYHFVSQRIMVRLKNETFTWTSTQLRLWNEGATILLFAIVFVVVLKSAINWLFGVVGLLGLAVLLMMLIKWYKVYRSGKEK